jgi:hypothetical protein
LILSTLIDTPNYVKIHKSEPKPVPRKAKVCCAGEVLSLNPEGAGESARAILGRNSDQSFCKIRTPLALRGAIQCLLKP